MKTLSIIIVTWNGKQYVEECLNSLGAYSQDPGVEIIVVDNASWDGTFEFVRDTYQTVRLIQNTENLGFAKANNIGIRASSGQFVCLINSDVRVFEGCIDKMHFYMCNNPQIGLVGPRMLGPDGKSYRSYMGMPTLWRMFCRALALDVLFPRSKVFGGFLMPYFNRDQIADVDILNGWFWMTRREALNDVGLLDENLFMYGEDLDWSRRFRKAGWRVVYFPKAESLHYGGASSAIAPIHFLVEMQRANFQFWKKNYGPASQLLYLFIVLIHQSVRVLGYLLLMCVKEAKRSDAAFKVKRSLACMRWAIGSKTREDNSF